MTVTYAVILFGGFAIVSLIAFGMSKLQHLCKQMVCICKPEVSGGILISCKKFKKIYSDFLVRRNEFWCIFGQDLIIIVIIIVLTVLLLKEKVSSEAALPIIAGLSSFAVGKGITSAKTNNTKSAKLPKKQMDNNNS
jgi:H+/gluconate symporter-like permease